MQWDLNDTSTHVTTEQKITWETADNAYQHVTEVFALWKSCLLNRKCVKAERSRFYQEGM